MAKAYIGVGKVESSTYTAKYTPEEFFEFCTSLTVPITSLTVSYNNEPPTIFMFNGLYSYVYELDGDTYNAPLTHWAYGITGGDWAVEPYDASSPRWVRYCFYRVFNGNDYTIYSFIGIPYPAPIIFVDGFKEIKNAYVGVALHNGRFTLEEFVEVFGEDAVANGGIVCDDVPVYNEDSGDYEPPNGETDGATIKNWLTYLMNDWMVLDGGWGCLYLDYLDGEPSLCLFTDGRKPQIPPDNGVDSIARKVKKAYVGVGGVARLFFSGTE